MDEREELARIARRIADARAKGGWTLSEVASRAGLDRERVAAIESGEREPQMTEFVRLARALDASPADLVRWPESGGPGPLPRVTRESAG